VQTSSEGLLLRSLVDSPNTRRKALEIETQKAEAIAAVCSAVGQGVQSFAKAFCPAPQGKETGKSAREAFAYLSKGTKFKDNFGGLEEAERILTEGGIDDEEELLVAPQTVRHQLMELLKAAPGQIFSKVFLCDQ
jgi:hypothetical protein